MRSLVFVLLGVLLSQLTPQFAFGQSVCFEYRAQKAEFPSQYTGWVPSPSAACSAGASDPSPVFACSGGTFQRTYTSTAFTPSGGEPSGGLCTFQQTNTQVSGSCSLAAPSTFQRTYSVRAAAECPPPEVPCQDLANKSFQVVASATSDGFMPPTTGCFGSCEAFQQANNQHVRTGPSGARDWLLRYKWTGLECEAPPPVEGETDTTAEQCAGSATDLEFCAGPQSGENCGYVNGKYMCLESLADDKCFVNEDGSMLCAEGAGMPPKPDNGTPGVEATPDGQLQLAASETITNTYNYYNNTTVGGSSRPVPGGSNPDGTGVTPGQGGEGPDDEEEGEDCAPGTECAGELPAIGGEGDCTVGECAVAFYGRIANAPILQAVSGVGAGFPAGSCPSWTIEVFDREISLSGGMCSVWENIKGVLGAVFLIVWAWIATRVVLSS